MESRRCPHISGDPKQRTHTLPCRDVFCFSCLYKIPGLMTGDVFSCPFCGGFSQYINPREAVLGSSVDAMQHNDSRSICSDSAEGESHVSKKSSVSSDATEEINLHGKSYSEGTLGMNSSSSPNAENHASSMYKGRHTSQENDISVSAVHADASPSSSSFPPDDVVGNVTQEELDQQHELLHRFSPAKRSTPPTDSSSDYTNFRSTGYKSGFPLDDIKSRYTGQSIHNDPLSATTSDRTSIPGGENPSEYRNYTVVNVDPSDCLAPPDEVVGHISADEFQQQDKLFSQFNQQLHFREHELYNNPGRCAYPDSAQKDHGESSKDHKTTRTIKDDKKVVRVKCELHQRPFIMFCPSCNCMLCNYCLDVNAHKHTIKASAIPIRTAKERAATSFEKHTQTLSFGHEKYRKECERMEKDNSEILRKTEELKKQVEMETLKAHQQLDRNLEDIKNAIDQKVKQIFESRDCHKDNVDKVKHRLDEATAIIRNAADMIESDNIPTAMLAEDEVINIIREVNKTSLNPPNDTFNLECRFRDINRFDSSLAPVSLTTNLWAPRTYSSLNFYIGGGI